LQAEDGIRDYHVTGVQTCALPISASIEHACGEAPPRRIFYRPEHDPEKWKPLFGKDHAPTKEHDPEKWIPVFGQDHARTKSHPRSEERRVGKGRRRARVQWQEERK